MSEFLLNYFTPKHLENKVSPEYNNLRAVVLGVLLAACLLFVLPLPLLFVFPQAALYYGIFVMCIIILFTIKRTGAYLIPTVVTLAVGYGVVVYIILVSGGIFSPHVIMLYLLMLTGFWANRKLIGQPAVLVNLIAFGLIYFYTVKEPFKLSLIDDRVSTKQYFLLFNSFVTLFFGVFFSFVVKSYESARNEAVEIQQLYNTRHKAVESTSDESSNPMIAFYQLIEFGQNFFDQFDINFSAKPLDKSYFDLLKMRPDAHQDLIAIFKEAMTNTAAQSGAKNVVLKMFIDDGYLNIQLKDDGNREYHHPSNLSIDLQNMESLSRRNNFIFKRRKVDDCTYVQVSVIISNA